MTSRRGFLTGLSAAVVAPTVSWGAVGSPAVLSAARKPDGQFCLVGLTVTGEECFRIPLDGRGHAAAAHPTEAEAVAIARRPDTFAKVIDCATGQVRRVLEAPTGRHFYGHGAFSKDGTLLFTTENDIASGEGRIGVWDRGLSYQRIGEFASHGIGPHEILRLPNGLLAVANGGIRTHPDTGREKLNLDTMRANLAILTQSGALVDSAEVAPDIHQNSLRHIAAAPDGTVACAFQWQGDPYDTPALAALYRPGKGLGDCALRGATERALDGYVGSICALPEGGFALTSPRGGRVVVLDAGGTEIAAHRALDICGVSRRQVATDGSGRVYRVSREGLHLLAQTDLAFDNHLTEID